MTAKKRQFTENSTFAKWSDVEPDGRLHLPTEITSMLSWYVSGSACEVLMELREEGSLLIHAGSRIVEVEEQRLQVLEDFHGVEGLRRVALTHSVFCQGKFGRSNRRITLQASVLAHLGVAKPSRVLCLVYADRIEILSKSKYLEMSELTKSDVTLDLPDNAPPDD
jgi:hypothetical protein